MRPSASRDPTPRTLPPSPRASSINSWPEPRRPPSTEDLSPCSTEISRPPPCSHFPRAGFAPRDSRGARSPQSDLAAKVVDGTVRLQRIGRLRDEDIVTSLSIVRGIGQWTAEMFLIFQLRRLDVWPVGDYGVRTGYALAYGLKRLPTPKELQALGDRFRPYRTVAAWYCWRAVSEQRKQRKRP